MRGLLCVGAARARSYMSLAVLCHCARARACVCGGEWGSLSQVVEVQIQAKGEEARQQHISVQLHEIPGHRKMLLLPPLAGIQRHARSHFRPLQGLGAVRNHVPAGLAADDAAGDDRVPIDLELERAGCQEIAILVTTLLGSHLY